MLSLPIINSYGIAGRIASGVIANEVAEGVARSLELDDSDFNEVMDRFDGLTGHHNPLRATFIRQFHLAGM